MPPLPILDSRVHLWDTGGFAHPWISDIAALNRSFLLQDHDRACGSTRVESIVFIQCEADPSHDMNEARWVMDLARDDARIKAIIARVRLEWALGGCSQGELRKLFHDNALKVCKIQ